MVLAATAVTQQAATDRLLLLTAVAAVAALETRVEPAALAVRELAA
jgi:hypothetical protein